MKKELAIPRFAFESKFQIAKFHLNVVKAFLLKLRESKLWISDNKIYSVMDEVYVPSSMTSFTMI